MAASETQLQVLWRNETETLAVTASPSFTMATIKRCRPASFDSSPNSRSRSSAYLNNEATQSRIESPVETRSASAPGGATELIVTSGRAAQARIRRLKRRELLYPGCLGHKLRLQSANIWLSYGHLTRHFLPGHGSALPSLQLPRESPPPSVRQLFGFLLLSL